MKKLSLLTVLLMVCTFSTVHAQREKIRDRVESYRIAFFTEKLDLTSVEARDFWPIYNEYQDKLEKVTQAGRPDKSIDAMTDKELEIAIENRFKAEEEKVKIERAFYQSLKPVLPLRKIARIPQVEKAFKTAILRRMQEQRRGRD